MNNFIFRKERTLCRFSILIIIIFLFVISPLIFAAWAQFKVKSTFHKYAGYHSGQGYTAVMIIARQILDQNGLFHVKIEMTSGNLTDHFDPRATDTPLKRHITALRLSPSALPRTRWVMRYNTVKDISRLRSEMPLFRLPISVPPGVSVGDLGVIFFF